MSRKKRLQNIAQRAGQAKPLAAGGTLYAFSGTRQSIEAARDSYWIERMHEFGDAVHDFYTKRDQLARALQYVENTVSLCQLIPQSARQPVLNTALEGWVGALTASFTELSLIADALGITLEAEIAQQVQERVIGIKRALNDQDGGAYLYELAKEQSDLYRRIVNARPISNAGPRESEVVDWLCARLHSHAQTGLGIKDAYAALCADLESKPEGVKAEYIVYLGGWTLTAAERAYRRWRKKRT